MEYCEKPHFLPYLLIIYLRSLFSPPPAQALGQATIVSHLEPTSQVQGLESWSPALLRAEAGVLIMKLVAHGWQDDLSGFSSGSDGKIQAPKPSN